MKHLQTILFPIDFSEATAAMVPYVRECAERFSAKVTVLHAFDLAPSYIALPLAGDPCEYEDPPIPYTPAFQKLRDDRERRLGAFARDQLQMVSHSARIEDGEPASVIEWVAQRENVDLIMMATRGQGKFRRLLLGSVTAKLLHDVACAVFTSAHEAPPLAPTGGYRSIVCAVELNQEADVVLNTAEFITQVYGARVCVVHMEPTPSPHDVLASTEWLQQGMQKIMNAGNVKVPVDWKVRVLKANIPEGIRNAAIEEHADMVIVGRGHERARLSRIWSHLYAIIRESPCPVLSV